MQNKPDERFESTTNQRAVVSEGQTGGSRLTCQARGLRLAWLQPAPEGPGIGVIRRRARHQKKEPPWGERPLEQGAYFNRFRPW